MTSGPPPRLRLAGVSIRLKAAPRRHHLLAVSQQQLPSRPPVQWPAAHQPQQPWKSDHGEAKSDHGESMSGHGAAMEERAAVTPPPRRLFCTAG
eukprot:356488-Chlamydomonas_euryale.AAC.6